MYNTQSISEMVFVGFLLCLIIYRKSSTRSRAAYVWAGLVFVWKKSSLDKPLSYLSHPRLQAVACKWT